MHKRKVYKGYSFYLPDLDPDTVFVITSGDEKAYRANLPQGVSIDDILPEMLEIAPAKPSGDYMPHKEWEPLNEERNTVHRNKLTVDYPYPSTILTEICPPGKRTKQAHNHNYCLFRNPSQ